MTYQLNWEETTAPAEEKDTEEIPLNISRNTFQVWPDYEWQFERAIENEMQLSIVKFMTSTVIIYLFVFYLDLFTY